jgi:trehalose/maltose hydrolase-like predicted phosphorylase
LEDQKKLGQNLEMSDITIEGDKSTAIRFNIFQLNQTYLGQRLNMDQRIY